MNILDKLNDLHIGEISPNDVKRRYDPKEGLNKYRERIHRESAYTDKYKNLEFNFSKPYKPMCTISVDKYCSKCGKYYRVKKTCIGIICSNCKQYSKLIWEQEKEEDL